VPGRAEFTVVAWVASLSPSEGAIDAGGVVTVSGRGFDKGKRYAARFSCGEEQSALSLLAAPVSAQHIVFLVPEWRYGPCAARVEVQEEDGAPLDGGPAFRLVASWSGVSLKYEPASEPLHISVTRAPCCLAPSELRVSGAFAPAFRGECVFQSLSDPSSSRRSAALVDPGSCDAYRFFSLLYSRHRS